METAKTNKPLPPPLAAVAVAMDGRFLRRTVLATVACALVVAVMAGGYGHYAWAGRYLLFAVVPMGLYALTGLALKLMFEGRKGQALGLIALKIAGMAGLLSLYILWPVPKVDGRADMAQAGALFLGVATPFAVFFLRLIGSMMETQRKMAAQGATTPARPREEANSHS